MFGVLPAYGLFVRHARGFEFHHVDVGFMKEDRRPAFVRDQVKGATIEGIKAHPARDVLLFVLLNVDRVSGKHSPLVVDTPIHKVDRREL